MTDEELTLIATPTMEQARAAVLHHEERAEEKSTKIASSLELLRKLVDRLERDHGDLAWDLKHRGLGPNVDEYRAARLHAMVDRCERIRTGFVSVVSIAREMEECADGTGSILQRARDVSLDIAAGLIKPATPVATPGPDPAAVDVAAVPVTIDDF